MNCGARGNRVEGHGPSSWKAGSASVLWAILDQVVDGYAPVVGEVERDIEQVEGTVFSGEVAPTERIYFLRREVTNFFGRSTPCWPSSPRWSARPRRRAPALPA